MPDSNTLLSKLHHISLQLQSLIARDFRISFSRQPDYRLLQWGLSPSLMMVARRRAIFTYVKRWLHKRALCTGKVNQEATSTFLPGISSIIVLLPRKFQGNARSWNRKFQPTVHLRILHRTYAWNSLIPTFIDNCYLSIERWGLINDSWKLGWRAPNAMIN